MAPVTGWHRLFFAAVGLLALWVGVWGYFVPRRVDSAIPFLVPPLHARFLGAMYFSAVVAMIGICLARRWAEVRLMMPMLAIWTGMLFVVSLFHLDNFDFDTRQVQIWFAAYLVYPLIALWLAWSHRQDTARDSVSARSTGPGGPVPAGVTLPYRIQGIAVVALALALLALPGVMVAVWPWPITRLLAQIYSAPFLAFGVVSLLIARCRTWPEIRVGVTEVGVFAILVLVASLIHVELFSAGDAATWLWFGGLAAMVALYVSTVVRVGLRSDTVVPA